MEITITQRDNGKRNCLALEGPKDGPILIDRISLNGARYIASDSRYVMQRVAALLKLPLSWIHYSEKHGKHYLRLFGRKRDV